METLLSLGFITAVLLGSPGPVPLSLFLLGMTYGVRSTLAYYGGILTGLVLVMVLVKVLLVGSSQLFGDWMGYVGIVAALYMSFIAIQMIRSGLAEPEQTAYCPGFFGGCVFNLINPKAYGAFLAIFAQDAFQALPATQSIAVCFLVALSVDGAWLFAGAKIRQSGVNKRVLGAVRQLGGFAILTMVLVSQWEVWVR